METVTTNAAGDKLEDVLVLPDGQSLADATVQLLVRLPSGVMYTRTATIEDAATGAVSYTTVAEDVAESGLVQLRWLVTKDGKASAAPAERMMTIRVMPRC